MFSAINSSGSVLFEPPRKIGQTIYKCDKKFHLDPILEMYCNPKYYGVVFVTGKMYSFYLITKTGNHIENKKILSNQVDLPNKHKKGGQSSVRFARLHDERTEAYIKKLGELVVKSFLCDNNTKYVIEKLVIAGPSSKKNLLAKNELVKQYFNDKHQLLKTGDLNDSVVHETLDDIRNLIDISDDTKSDNIIEKVNDMLMIADDKLVFGVDEISHCLKYNELREIIVSDKETNIIKDIEAICNDKCIVHIIAHEKLCRLGINIIGIKWY